MRWEMGEKTATWAGQNAAALAVGLAVRALLWRTPLPDNDHYHWIAFVSHHAHTNDAMAECGTALSNNWPQSLDSCDDSLNAQVVFFVSYLTQVPMATALISSALQLLVAIILSVVVAKKGETPGLVLFYWLNPFVIAQCRVSLFGSLCHVMLLCMLLCMKHGWKYPICAILALAVSWDWKFAAALPIYLSSCLRLSTVGCIVATVAAYGVIYGNSIASHNVAVPLEAVRSYYPSIGVLWYLDGQNFSSFDGYFRRLLSLQPLMYGCPLAIRLGNEPFIALLVVVSIVILYRRESTAADVMLLLCLYMRGHGDVCRKMKYKTVILLSIVCPLLVSPTLLWLWVSAGTGNANFLFFQGLVMSIGCCLGISGFLNSLLVNRPPRSASE